MTPAQQLRSRMSVGTTSPGFQANGSCPTLIPFDHAATFTIKGIPGNIVQDVINISSDGVFVATAIGYGFEEERGRQITLNPARTSPFLPGNVTLGEISPAALIE